jgi:hypothetical protein
MFMKMETIVLKQGEKPEFQVMPPTQGMHETLLELNLTIAPAEAENSADEEMNVPLPKPCYERSNKGTSRTFSIQGVIERARSEPQRTHNTNFRREQLNCDGMTRSMPNLQCSRASHNRSLGLSLLDSQADQDQEHARERASSRAAEFSQILDDL